MIRTERIYGSEPEPDTVRILVDRLWPRGISKEKAKLNEWRKEIAPSAELRKWFGHRTERYEEFQERYMAELNENPYAAEFREKLDEYSQERSKDSPMDIVLLFGAKDTEHNNAVVLAKWLRETGLPQTE